MWQADSTFFGCHCLNRGNRVFHQHLQRNCAVGDPVDKGGIRAVFQQAADQVSQQCFMSADRCIHTARPVQLAVRHFADHLLIQRFTHAVQTLELILTGIIVIARQLINRG